MPTECKTGVGRIVWGHPMRSQQKKDDNNQLVLKDGRPVEQWVFGVAFPKAEFVQMIWPAMQSEAMTGFSQGFPPAFSWKYKDGDTNDQNGVPFANREGYAGCIVLTVSTEAFCPNVYKFINGQYVQMQADEIKTGDYIRAALNFKVNIPQNRAHKPGIFVNPVAIEFVGYGTHIQNGPDPMALFGGQQMQLPPGASLTPIASPNAPGMPGTGMMQPQPGQMPGTGMMQPQPGQMPATGMMQPQPGQMPATGMMQPQPGQMPAPATDFVTNAGMPGQMPPR